MQKELVDYSLSLEERETIPVYEEITDSWSVYSNVRKHITKLMKIFSEDEITKVTVNENGTVLEIWIDNASFEQVSFRSKSKPRNMTDEQRAALSERMKNLHRKKK